ncbi:hypothetical protein JZO70_05995 [Enterococcus sp. 669A]|uniref:Core-binding (CB) domain-containing protein n=1 Tax=Candidatus Enterococcus moelleringii TaxID=2815325 RepID=A0ABS3L9C3_9ENTE|nr:hypothetical protein [Enterococcus sp. 669A]MBO1305700.1 hypothetical protein [Enterococcus sp. 669A]
MENDSSQEALSNIELIHLARKKGRKMRRPLMESEFEYADLAVSRYGSWKSFLQAAGLKLDYPEDTVSDEHLIMLVQKKAAELGRSPTTKEFGYSSLAMKRYGSWRHFLQVAGLRDRKAISKISDEELIDLVIKQSAELGKAPTKKQFEHGDLAVERFGRWTYFLESAGMSPHDETFRRYLKRTLYLR